VKPAQPRNYHEQKNIILPKSKDVLKACLQSHPKARHRFKGLSKQWKHVSPALILVYFGIICITGATKI
jgi:hypothetical protein